MVAHRPTDLRHNHCGGGARIPSWIHLFSTGCREVSLMHDHGTQNDSPQVDEAAWKAWVQKNDAKDRIRSARRKKILGFVVILGVILIILWRSRI